MSDTPRTNEQAGYYDDSGCWKYREDGECVPSDFARELERKLAKAMRVVVQVEAWRNAHASAFRWAAAGEIKIKQEKELNAKANELLEKAFEEWEAGR